MKPWIFQDHRAKEKHGEKKAPWSVGWVDAKGRRRSKKIGMKSYAQKYRDKLARELLDNLVGDDKTTWSDFIGQYEEAVMVRWRSEKSRVDAKHAFKQFKTITQVKRVRDVDARMLDTYVAERMKMPGKKRGDTISPETIRKELRAVRAALNQAKRWKYLREVPPMPEVDGFGRDKPYVVAADFDKMLEHTEAARYPDDQNYTASTFWQALLATVWVTGMRKSALLKLRWEDVDLSAGIVLSRCHDNKRKRDQFHMIGPAAGLLAELYAVRKPGESLVFPWYRSLRQLDRELHRIEKAAGIHLPCREDHEHTDACHFYGFHSFRYAHATYNSGRVPDRDLQRQMGHASFTTTQRYIKYAEEHQERDYDVFLPKSLKASEE